jgi:hypothetical protein
MMFSINSASEERQQDSSIINDSFLIMEDKLSFIDVVS